MHKHGPHPGIHLQIARNPLHPPAITRQQSCVPITRDPLGRAGIQAVTGKPVSCCAVLLTRMTETSRPGTILWL